MKKERKKKIAQRFTVDLHSETLSNESLITKQKKNLTIKKKFIKKNKEKKQLKKTKQKAKKEKKKNCFKKQSKRQKKKKDSSAFHHGLHSKK